MILCSIGSLVQAALTQLFIFMKKKKFESQRPLGFAGHPAIETRCTTAVGSFKFEFSKFFLAESICLKLSFRLHVVAWQHDNGKYVRLKSRVRLNIIKSSGGKLKFIIYIYIYIRYVAAVVHIGRTIVVLVD